MELIEKIEFIRDSNKYIVSNNKVYKKLKNSWKEMHVTGRDRIKFSINGISFNISKNTLIKNWNKYRAEKI